MFDSRTDLSQLPASEESPETALGRCGHILIVDDDRAMAAMVGQYLAQHHYRISYEYDSTQAVATIRREQPDLLLLDLLMPVLDGLSICREIRPEFKQPIIMLTGLNEDVDLITGLELGADAYLTKPVKPRVLLAHIRAQLRAQPEHDHAQQEPSVIRCDDLVVDLKKRAVHKANNEVELTNAEFDLLALLACQRGSVVARNEIYQRLRKLEYNGIDRGIDLRISRLRKKLGDDPKCPQLIKTVRGVGYLFAG